MDCNVRKPEGNTFYPPAFYPKWTSGYWPRINCIQCGKMWDSWADPDVFIGPCCSNCTCPNCEANRE